MSIKGFVDQMIFSEQFQSSLAHHEIIDSVKAQTVAMSPHLPTNLSQGLRLLGIKELYSHQAEGLSHIKLGKNIVVVTHTASGKSIMFNLPILESMDYNPTGHALYLFPLKALEQDQSLKLNNLLIASKLENKITTGIYDGDTPTADRARMRKKAPNILITNPDMLHLSILAYHSSWEDFLRGLKFIVIDELHIYRGIFGSHILHVLHRLLRLCRYYGSNPQVIAASATISGAKDLAEQLTGLPFELIDKSGAPITKRHFFFLNPQTSYLTFALKVFIAAFKSNLKVILFTKSRRATELLYMWLKDSAPEFGDSVSSYRAGFLPEERRVIESQLSSGKLSGVISTSALELGIDIGGLDVCVMAGYPGTISTTWQRAGRVGRGNLPAAVCIVAGQDQLDQYFMKYSEEFFKRPVERAIVDDSNENIVRPHLLSAAQEIPINHEDQLWKKVSNQPLIAELEQNGKLLRSASGDRYFSAQRRPQRNIDIRATGGQVSIELEDSGKRLGSIGGHAKYAECHPGAIYLHRAEQYLVTELNLETKRALVKKAKVNHYTNAMFEKETEILEELQSKKLMAGKVTLSRLKVTEQLVGYQKRLNGSQELISQHDLSYPPYSYETIGLAISIPPEATNPSIEGALHFRGGIHGVEHALLALAPLFAICDRNDMGGYSQANHPQIGGPAVFLYDGYAGGIGLSKRLFDVFNELLERTYNLVNDCECLIGCPSCIHSPKCGHGNVPLDKASAVMTFEVLLGKRQIVVEKQSPVSNIKIDAIPAKEIIMPIKIATPRLIKVPSSWQKEKTGVVFDIETQRSADEVGGWNNVKSMGVACVVAYRFPGDEWFEFQEGDVDELIKLLDSSDLVIGFNQIRFDYEVLSGYSGYDFRKLRSYDILVEITNVLGHRLKMNSVTAGTLGALKTAGGVQSLDWWRNGEHEKVIEYCRQDVALTRDLFFHILNKEYLLFEKRGIGLVRIPLNFQLDIK